MVKAGLSVVRGLLWLSACTLAPTLGRSGAAPTQLEHRVARPIPSFVSSRGNGCPGNPWSRPRYTSGEASSRATRDRRGGHSRCGEGRRRELLHAEAPVFRTWRSDPLQRRCRRLGALRSTSVSSESGGDLTDQSPTPPLEGPAGENEGITPGEQPRDGLSKADSAAIAYAEGGDWTRALQLLKAMRDEGQTPSVAAYVATIEACRREHLFSYASALFSDMNKVCMPEDLFAQYAARHPNDPGVTQTQRVFSLLLMMREDEVSPLEETYRAIMGLCTKEGLWHLSLLLLQHLRHNGLIPGKFVLDEICTGLFKSGHPEMATLVYEVSLDDPPVDELTAGARAPFDPLTGKLDLHNLTVSMSLAIVRITLLDMVRRPASRPYHDPKMPLRVVTGMGRKSKDGEAVIKPQVMALLTEMGLEPEFMPYNEGCIELRSEALHAYIAGSPQHSR